MPSVPYDAWGVLMVVLGAVIPVCGSYIITKLQTRHLEGKHTELGHRVDKVTQLGEDVKKLTKDLAVVKDEVKNTHRTNFREDVDKIDKKVDRIGVQVAGIDRRTRRIGDEIRSDRKYVDDFIEHDFEPLRKDSYAAIQRGDRVIAKHHPEDA